MALVVRAADPVKHSGPYRGPMDNGIYAETGLAKAWPPDGPKLLWKANIGEGYGGVTVVDGMVYVSGGTGASLFGFTLGGEQKLKYGFGSTAWKRFSGSKSTTLVRDGVAIVTRPNADIIALDLKTGEPKWQMNAWTKFGSTVIAQGWGYPSTPALFENKVILNPVSRDDAVPPVVAVDFATGETLWKADAGTGKRYSCGDHSASVIVHNGRTLNINPTWRYILCLDPKDGKFLWEIPDIDTKVGSEKSLTPTYGDGYLVFDRSGWASCIKLSDDGLTYTPKWSRPHGQGFSHAVIMGKRVYLGGDVTQQALAGEKALEVAKAMPLARARLPRGAAPLPDLPGGLLCLDAETGETIDQLRLPGGLGHVVAADGMIYAINMPRSPERERAKAPEEAQLGLTVTLIEPVKDGMAVRGQFKPPMTIDDAKQVRELEFQANINPVLAEGRLFIRYGPLWVYDVRPQAAGTPAYAPPALGPASTMDLCLKRAVEGGHDLWVTVQLKDGVPAASAAAAPSWNRATHQVDLKDLKLGGNALTGALTVTLQPDATVPADKKPIVLPLTITATVANGRITGTFAGGKADGTAVTGRLAN
jgi:outer membrane protein assembly factor BamB